MTVVLNIRSSLSFSFTLRNLRKDIFFYPVNPVNPVH